MSVFFIQYLFCEKPTGYSPFAGVRPRQSAKLAQLALTLKLKKAMGEC